MWDGFSFSERRITKEDWRKIGVNSGMKSEVCDVCDRWLVEWLGCCRDTCVPYQNACFLSSRCSLNSRFLLVCSPKDRKGWLKSLGPCLLCGRPTLSSKLLSSTELRYCAIVVAWEVSQQRKGSPFLLPSVSFCLSLKKVKTNKQTICIKLNHLFYGVCIYMFVCGGVCG